MAFTLEPFSLLLLLVFLMGLLAVLGLWFLLTLPTGRRPDPAPPPAQSAPQPPRVVAPRSVAPGSLSPHAARPSSNDEVRGARVKRPASPSAKKSDSDLFERFLRNKNDDLDF